MAGLLDFLRGVWEQPARQDAYKRYGGNYEQIMEEEQERLKFAETERQNKVTNQAFRVKEHEMTQERHASQQKYYADMEGDRLEKKRVDDAALKVWGQDNYGVPMGEAGPEPSLPWLRARHAADLLDKRTLDKKASELRYEDAKIDFGQEQAVEAIRSPEQQAEEANRMAELGIESKQLTVDKQRADAEAGYPGMLGTGKQEKILALRDRADNQIEMVFGINMQDVRNVGEDRILDDLFKNKSDIAAGLEGTESFEEDWGGFTQQSEADKAARVPTRIAAYMNGVATQLGMSVENYVITNDPKHDQAVVSAVMMFMIGEVPPAEWPEQIQAAAMAIEKLGLENPQYLQMLDSVGFFQGQ